MKKPPGGPWWRAWSPPSLLAVCVLLAVAAATPSVFAVDGVSLGEMFPILDAIAASLRIGGAMFIVWLGFGIGKSEKVGVSRRVIASSLAGVILIPLVHPLVQTKYATHLCEVEAEIVVLIPIEQWAPGGRNAQMAPAGAPQGVRTRLTSGLVMDYVRVERMFGVLEFKHRLIDQVSDTTLMTSKSFSGGKGNRATRCAQDVTYWKQLELYRKKAESIARAS